MVYNDGDDNDDKNNNIDDFQLPYQATVLLVLSAIDWCL